MEEWNIYIEQLFQGNKKQLELRQQQEPENLVILPFEVEQATQDKKSGKAHAI